MAQRKSPTTIVFPSQSSARGAAADSAGEAQYSDEIGTAFIDGVTFRSKAVQYADVDGMAIVEGDIDLGPVEQVVERPRCAAWS